MICAEDPFRCRPGEINGSMKMTGEVRLDGGNYGNVAFRTRPNQPNWNCRMVGENNTSKNGAHMYGNVEFEYYLGNVGLINENWYNPL